MSEEQTQDLCVEMTLIIKSPKMPAIKLARGIKEIVMSKWPECEVVIDEIEMVSVSSLDFATEVGNG